MSRTKWMRLGVRDPADILRWAGDQDVRRLDEFRHRRIHGREFVSFRMVPRYAIQIGTNDIVVVAHVVPGRWRRIAVAARKLQRACAGRAAAFLALLKPRATVLPAPAQMAELFQFDARRVASPFGPERRIVQ